MFRRKKRPKPSTTWGRVWHFIWHEDSVASWLVNIVLAFVLIKYIVYPGLGLLLGSPFPVVAVVSSSMEHHPSDFDGWWEWQGEFYEQWGISKREFLQYPFRDGFNKGDIMVLAGVDPKRLEVGTVIVYQSGKPYPIIHRYIGRNPNPAPTGEHLLVSKGDNNPGLVVVPTLDETSIREEQLLGRAVARIPYLGYVKIWAVDLVNLLR